MKQGDAKSLLIQLDGISKYDVESIKVIFKQDRCNSADILKSATYKADGTGGAVLTGEVLKVFFSIEDTFLFIHGRQFYADYQVKLKGTDEMLSVETTGIFMRDSLFNEEEALADD